MLVRRHLSRWAMNPLGAGRHVRRDEDNARRREWDIVLCDYSCLRMFDSGARYA